VAYPGIFSEGVFTRNFFRGGGGVNKFSWRQRAERTEIWGLWKLSGTSSQWFHSICKWVKPVFLLGCYGFIFHGSRNLASEFRGEGFEPPKSPLRYATEDNVHCRSKGSPYVNLSRFKVCISQIKHPTVQVLYKYTQLFKRSKLFRPIGHFEGYPFYKVSIFVCIIWLNWSTVHLPTLHKEGPYLTRWLHMH
jgi:hypothetical protein